MRPLIRVVLYNRVSDPRGRQEPENQARQLRERIVREGQEKNWKLVQEYVDEETASGKRERPQFLKLFEDARAGKFDLVIFWSLDRFSREGVLKTLEYLETLKDSGVGWLSHTEPYLDSLGPFRDAVLAILACIAKQERIRISERIKAALDRRKAGGKRHGGRPKQVDWDRFARACKVGFSTEELARMFGLSPNWVRIKRKEIVDNQQVGLAKSLPTTTGSTVTPGLR